MVFSHPTQPDWSFPEGESSVGCQVKYKPCAPIPLTWCPPSIQKTGQSRSCSWMSAFAKGLQESGPLTWRKHVQANRTAEVSTHLFGTSDRRFHGGHLVRRSCGRDRWLLPWYPWGGVLSPFDPECTQENVRRVRRKTGGSGDGKSTTVYCLQRVRSSQGTSEGKFGKS